MLSACRGHLSQDFGVFLDLPRQPQGSKSDSRNVTSFCYFGGLMSTLGHSMFRDSLMELCCPASSLFYSLDVFFACLGSSCGHFRALWHSLALFGTSVASLLGPLGLPFAALLAQDAARRQQGAPRQTPKSPQRPKTDPQNVTYACIFWGPFFYRFQHSLSEGFLDAWPLKIDDFSWDVLQKCWFSLVTRKKNM